MICFLPSMMLGTAEVMEFVCRQCSPGVEVIRARLMVVIEARGPIRLWFASHYTFGFLRVFNWVEGWVLTSMIVTRATIEVLFRLVISMAGLKLITYWNCTLGGSKVAAPRRYCALWQGVTHHDDWPEVATERPRFTRSVVSFWVIIGTFVVSTFLSINVFLCQALNQVRKSSIASFKSEMSLLRDFCWNIQASFQISCELLVRAGFFLDVGKKNSRRKKNFSVSKDYSRFFFK